MREAFSIEGIPYIIGIHEDWGDYIENVYLFNLDDFSNRPVFQWLEAQEIINLYAKFLVSQEKFFVSVQQNYGADFGISLSMENILSSSNYSEMMQRYELRRADGNIFEFSTSNLGIMFVIEQNGVILRDFWTDKNTYFLDFDTKTLIQYCHLQKSKSLDDTVVTISMMEGM